MHVYIQIKLCGLAAIHTGTFIKNKPTILKDRYVQYMYCSPPQIHNCGFSTAAKKKSE